MRKVDRSSVKVPESLQPGAAGSIELAAALLHRDDDDPDKKTFKFSAYKRDDVKAALEELFRGKCAYCETLYAVSAPVDVEHYRPKGAVAEDRNHGGYWWLAMDWDNLLPSCIDCNRKRGQQLVTISTSLAELAADTKPGLTQSGKKDSFPLAATGVRAVYEAREFGAEQALLLDPCRDDPGANIAFNFDSGNPVGLAVPIGDQRAQERGAVSIQIYGLNRLALVQDRTRILRRLEFLGDLIIDLSASIAELETPAATTALDATPARSVAPRLRLLRDRTLAELKSFADDKEPYSAMTSAWLRQFKERIRSGGAGPAGP